MIAISDPSFSNVHKTAPSMFERIGVLEFNKRTMIDTCSAVPGICMHIHNFDGLDEVERK